MRFAVPFMIGWSTLAFVVILMAGAFALTAEPPVVEVATGEQWRLDFDGDGAVDLIVEVVVVDDEVDHVCEGRVIVTLVSVSKRFCFRYGECRLIPDYMLCALPADLDGDGDVDLADFAEFQKALTGPEERANDTRL